MLWFLNIPFVRSLNTHEDSQNGHVENLIGFHSDFLHLFKMCFPHFILKTTKSERHGKAFSCVGRIHKY
jgi:hypothetical protein